MSHRSRLINSVGWGVVLTLSLSLLTIIPFLNIPQLLLGALNVIILENYLAVTLIALTYTFISTTAIAYLSEEKNQTIIILTILWLIGTSCISWIVFIGVVGSNL